MALDNYSEIWCIDFEFRAPDGELPEIRCMVAAEYHSGRFIRMWADELGDRVPFNTGKDTLIVAYYASAEILCLKALGWRQPTNLLDLYVEFRRQYNGLFLKAGKGLVIQEIDADYGVFDGTTFKADRFESWLAVNDIPWPRLESGKLDLKGDTFREVAKGHPELEPLKELRHTLSEMRLNKLAVGQDGRNRCLLSPFSAKTSRNQPSTTKFIFGPSAWLRGLIKPARGHGIAYIDWSQQEFAIAAVLSGDKNMQQAYVSGDPYLEFAKQAGAVPPNGTKQSHPIERKLFKACVLGVQYGMGPESLSKRIGEPVIKGRELIQLHKETFPDYWKWATAVVDYALTTRTLHSTMGWSISLNDKANARALANWPTQTNGAEIMRLAVILATEAEIKVCCPVHDALLIESPIETLDRDIKRTQQVMQQAGEIILEGFKLRTDVDRVVYPDRYMDGRGLKMWNKIMDLIGGSELE